MFIPISSNLILFRLTKLAHVLFRLNLNVIVTDKTKFVNTICNAKVAITVPILPMDCGH